MTGGLGRVGLAVARWLARGGVRHIVLTSRTGLPDRASSASLADHASADDLAGGDAIARRIAH
ncbi:MAG: KR domain-containing protein, partial [Acidobacteria bacterium ACB2]|nr:KR domain-containing protein [Acidobacteria bacterium ACB2]